MKKTLTILFVTAFLFSSKSFAQLSYGVGAGSTFYVNNGINGELDDYGLGLSTGFHYGVKLRFGIPLTPVSVVGSGYWTKMSSSGSYQGASVEFSQTMITFAGGAELTFIPGPLKLFLAADYLHTKWNKGTLKVNSTSYQIDAASRNGLAVGLGAKFTWLPIIDVELVAKYNMHNLFDKEEGEKSFNTYTITANVMF